MKAFILLKFCVCIYTYTRVENNFNDNHKAVALSLSLCLQCFKKFRSIRADTGLIPTYQDLENEPGNLFSREVG